MIELCETCRNGCPDGGCNSFTCPCACNCAEVSDEFKTWVAEFMDDNDEAMRRLASIPPAVFGVGCMFCGGPLEPVGANLGVDEDRPHANPVDPQVCEACHRERHPVGLDRSGVRQLIRRHRQGRADA